MHFGARRIALEEVGLEKAPGQVQLQEEKACPAPCLPNLLRLMQSGVTPLYCMLQISIEVSLPSKVIMASVYSSG